MLRLVHTDDELTPLTKVKEVVFEPREYLGRREVWSGDDDTGGWVYRWTDQQFWMPALRAAGVADASIVDFSTWRHRKFEHNAKTAHQCERPREVKNASDPCARKIQDERGKWVHTQVCWEMRMAALGKTKTKRK